MAKMLVKRNLLPNIRNFNVLNMLRFTLWGPDIFPKKAFEGLRTKNLGKTNLVALLGISPKLPEDIANTKDETDNSLNHQNKKQKVQHYQPTKKGGNTRGSRGGRKHNKGKNGHQQHQNKNGNKQAQQRWNNRSQNVKQNKQKGNSFPKGKKNNNQ